MSRGCSKGSKCGCGGMKDMSYNCGCGDMSHNYPKDMSYNCGCGDMSHNYAVDMSHNYPKDISCNWEKDSSYNVTSSHCKSCNKLLTNSISLYSEVCDCSFNYFIYTGDISHAEIEIEFSEGGTGPTGPIGEIGPIGPI